MRYSTWKISFTYKGIHNVTRHTSLILIQPDKWNFPEHTAMHEAVKQYFVDHDVSPDTNWSGESFRKEGLVYCEPTFTILETEALIDFVDKDGKVNI